MLNLDYSIFGNIEITHKNKPLLDFLVKDKLNFKVTFQIELQGFYQTKLMIHYWSWYSLFGHQMTTEHS